MSEWQPFFQKEKRDERSEETGFGIVLRRRAGACGLQCGVVVERLCGEAEAPTRRMVVRRARPAGGNLRSLQQEIPRNREGQGELVRARPGKNELFQVQPGPAGEVGEGIRSSQRQETAGTGAGRQEIS